MMPRTAQDIERLTISLPASIAKQIDDLKGELHLPKSEILRQALEQFLISRRKDKIREVADMMATEYAENSDLTAFTALDGEDFR
jgi:metal-responsive CopG/Arc/MetJ family transcriptional regulator